MEEEEVRESEAPQKVVKRESDSTGAEGFLNLSEDLLLHLASFADVPSLNYLFTSNNQLFQRMLTSQRLAKALCERLYPSVKLVHLKNYIPLLQR